MRQVCPDANSLHKQKMLTGKQRSYLKKMAHDLKPTVFLGRNGMTDNIKSEMEQGLENRELVKVKLQEGCDLKAKDVANYLAVELRAEFVQAIGHKFVLYRESKSKKKEDRIQVPK